MNLRQIALNRAEKRFTLTLDLRVQNRDVSAVKVLLERRDYKLEQHTPAGPQAPAATPDTLRFIRPTTLGALADKEVAVQEAGAVARVLTENHLAAEVRSMTWQPLPVRAWYSLRNKRAKKVLELALLDPAETEAYRANAANVHQVALDDIKLSPARDWSLTPESRRLGIFLLILGFALGLATALVRASPVLARNILLAVFVVAEFAGAAYLFRSRAIKVALSQLALIASVMAAASYFVTRYAYSAFYQPFNLTPEAVGLDYRSVISNQPVYVFLTSGSVLVVAIAVLALVKFVGSAARFSAAPIAAAAVATVIVLLIGTGFLSQIYNSGITKAEAIRQGNEIDRKNTFFDWPTAPRVAVTRATAPALDGPILATADLRLMGHVSGTYVLYDSTSGETVRLPDSEPLLVDTNGSNRLVVVRDQGFQPSALFLQADSSRQKLTVIDETTRGCMIGPLEKERTRGQEGRIYFIGLATGDPDTTTALNCLLPTKSLRPLVIHARRQ